MKTPNPEYLERVNQLVNQCPYFELLSMKIVDVGIGFSVLEMELAKKQLHHENTTFATHKNDLMPFSCFRLFVLS